MHFFFAQICLCGLWKYGRCSPSLWNFFNFFLFVLRSLFCALPCLLAHHTAAQCTYHICHISKFNERSMPSLHYTNTHTCREKEGWWSKDTEMDNIQIGLVLCVCVCAVHLQLPLLHSFFLLCQICSNFPPKIIIIMKSYDPDMDNILCIHDVLVTISRLPVYHRDKLLAVARWWCRQRIVTTVLQNIIMRSPYIDALVYRLVLESLIYRLRLPFIRSRYAYSSNFPVNVCRRQDDDDGATWLKSHGEREKIVSRKNRLLNNNKLRGSFILAIA